MIKIDEETRQMLAKYVGPDGKLIIDDSLPEDIKESFQFFNDEGVNILDFAANNELHLHVTDEPEPEAVEDIEWEEVSEATSEVGEQPTAVAQNPAPVAPVAPAPLSEEKIAEVNQNLNDLNDMF